MPRKRKNKWGFKYAPNATKEQIEHSLQIEYAQAMSRLNKLGIPGLSIKLPAISSGEQAFKVVLDIRKINRENILVDTSGNFVGTLGEIKYLFYTPIVRKQYKNKTFEYDYKKLSASQVNELKRIQERVNKKRKKFGLQPITGLRFDKSKSYEQIKKEVREKGNITQINTEQQRFINGVLTTLESAYQLAVEYGNYNLEDLEKIKEIKETIKEMNETDKSKLFKKLYRIYKNNSTKNPFDLFGSESQGYFAQTELIDQFENEFNIVLDIQVQEGDVF